jgi:hypothetical protein
MGSAMHHVHHGQDAEYGNDCGHVRERPEEMQVEGVDTQGWTTLSDEGKLASVNFLSHFFWNIVTGMIVWLKEDAQLPTLQPNPKS